ncbi:MAG: caspase domain-containing protein [Microcystaceae cyanobacterium]
MVNKAVLCGINQYTTQTQLRGCINDVNNLTRLLQSFQFLPENIRQLTDYQVTKAAVIDAYYWLIQDAQAGDQLVFHFSGHGSYVPDQQGDEIDGTDEIICLYNMDFFNPETYIRDDEWNDMIAAVPEQVALTFIFDCCHSGTGTRGFAVNLSGHPTTLLIDQHQRGGGNLTAMNPLINRTTLLNQSDYDNLIHEQSVILPRYIIPPPELQEYMMTAARTKGLRTTRSSTPAIYKHLFLAGCRDDQTAADAYIDQDFHGAFTYYLCKTLREQPYLGSQEIIQIVAQALQEDQFTQVPQHEGTTRFNSIFQLPTQLNTPNSTVALSNPETMTNLTPDNQKLLIEAYMKLIDTLGISDASIAQMPNRSLRQIGARYLIYVHGISNHNNNYSQGWWDSLRPHVSPIFGNGDLGDTRREVLWSDLVNQGTRASSGVNPIEEQMLRQQIEFILEEREKQAIAQETQDGQVTRQITPTFIERGGGFSIDDFLIYMLNPRMRQNIINRFKEEVQPLLMAGAELDIIAHSWGTVVAYEGLRELETLSLSGRVNSFFTVGSALSVGPVRSSLRQANRDGRRPRFVERWVNLNAKGDLVGGVLRDKFDVDYEFLDLEPVGCSRNFFRMYNLSCAHSSYFVSNNIQVNRDIFARFI